MFYVGNRVASVYRNGELVRLDPGAPIPEAASWPNLARAIKQGRVYTDGKGDDQKLIAQSPSHSRSWLEMSAPSPAPSDAPQEGSPAEAESVDAVAAAIDAALGAPPADSPPAVDTSSSKRGKK